jgi:hypothetical protein
MKQWYEKLFENYGHRYDPESFEELLTAIQMPL